MSITALLHRPVVASPSPRAIRRRERDAERELKRAIRSFVGGK